MFFFFVSDPTYGDSIDYVYGKLGVVHSYCLELRPGEENDNGFLVSACEINQTGGEILAALKAITPILAKERVDENDKLKVKYEKKRRAWKRRKLRRREMKIGK